MKQVFQSLSKFRLRNFQSFDADGAEIDSIKKFNIIIGPNNSGKSKILSAFKRLAQGTNQDIFLGSINDSYEIEISRFVQSKEFIGSFSESVSGGGVISGNHRHFGESIGDLNSIGVIFEKGFICTELSATDRNISSSDLFRVFDGRFNKNAAIWAAYARPKGVISIAAERDVRPESKAGVVKILPNGSNTTNLVRHFLTHVSADASLVEDDMLKDLNTIVWGGEEVFRRILVKEIENGNWEIVLDHSHHGLVPLSQCGSGLKSIFILLAQIHLELNGFEEGLLLIFEEPENNLHPEVQRNLYQYIDDVIPDNCVIVFATHSSVNLDFFQGDDSSAVYQIYVENGYSKVRRIEAFRDGYGVLDALGVKASDGLHANCAIWVEGPSDRIYLNKWINIWSGGKFKEGREYAIMFYGGRLLSHLTVDEQVVDLINLLRINRNSAILIDSDKKSPGASINATKLRILSEAKGVGVLCWVTKGREIENYIPRDFLRSIDEQLGNLTWVSDVPKALAEHREINGKRIRDKISLALVVTDECDSWRALDIDERMKELIGFIEAAN